MQNRLGKQNIYKLSPGNRFRQYRIVSILGKGAMGVVYKAFDESLRRHVALKVLQTSFIGEKEHRQFVREVKAIANLNHDNIVKLYEVGVDPTHYFTMEYIEGETLAQILKNENISHAAIVRIVSKIALGLYHAHVRGIVHGDIKPENIMITIDREPKIMDFGLAKEFNSSQLSQSGIQGTPAYLPPEQLQNNAVVDKRADIYALGVTLYRSLAGQLPFNEKNYVSLFYQIINESPCKLRSIDNSIPSDLEIICEKCMQKSPQKRYANARFLARDLQNYLVGRPLWVESSSSVVNFIKYLFGFWWLELLLTVSCIYLLITAIDRLGLFTVVEVENNKVFTKEQQQRFSYHQKKSEKIYEWYKEKNYAIHHLQLLSQRILLKDERWMEDVKKAIDNVYREIERPRGIDLKLAIQLFQIIMELQRGEFIDKKFFKVCKKAFEVAKKGKLLNYIIKFEQFLEIYRVNERLRANKKKYGNDANNFHAKHEQEKRIVTQAMDKITIPYGCFYLAYCCNDIWLREKLLLHAISGESNYRFYGKLGEFYIHNHFYHEGIALCRHQLRYNPYAPLAHYHIARGLTFIEEYDNALEHLQFLEKNFFYPGRALLFFEKARIFIIQKKFGKAKKALQDAHDSAKERKNNSESFQEEHNKWQKIMTKMMDENFVLDFADGEAVNLYYNVGAVNKAYELVNKIPHHLPLRLAIYHKILDRKMREFDTADEIWKKIYDTIISTLRIEKEKKILIYTPILYRYAFDFLTSRHTAFYKNTYTKSTSANMNLLHSVGKSLREYYFVPLYKAHFLKGRGSYNSAISSFDKAKRLAPWYWHEIEVVEKICLARWYQYGDVEGLSTKQKRDIAFRLAKQIIHDYNYDPAHNLLGFIYIFIDVNKSRYHFEQIQVEKLAMPDFLDFHFDRAHLYAKQEMYREAVEYLEQYLKLNPDFSYGQSALKTFREKLKSP